MKIEVARHDMGRDKTDPTILQHRIEIRIEVDGYLYALPPLVGFSRDSEKIKRILETPITLEEMKF